MEVDEDAGAVLMQRFPAARLYRDVRHVGAASCVIATAQRVKRAAWPRGVSSSVALQIARQNIVSPTNWLVGGFPCQDVSVAGKRSGLIGARTGLFWEFMRLVDELKPQGVLLENVPGLLSSNGGRDFHTVLEALAERGLRRAYRILDSQYFGVPQRRRRVFIVGCARTSGLDPTEILFESFGGDRHPAPRRPSRARVAASLRSRAHSPGVNAPGRGGEDDSNLIIPFDTTQITSAKNVSAPRAGDPCHPLAAGAHPPTIAFNWQSGGDVRHSCSEQASLSANQTPAVYPISSDAASGRSGDADTPSVDAHGQLRLRAPSLGIGAAGEPSFTVSAGTPVAIAVVARPLKAGGNDRRDESHETYIADTLQGGGNSGQPEPGSGIVLTAEGERARALVGSMHKKHDDDTDTLIPVAHTLSTGRRQIEETMLPVASPITASTGHHGHSSPRGDGRDNLEIAFALRADPGGISQGHNTNFPNGVRRLTPLECERLQGYPDGWTCRCGNGQRGTQFCTCPDTPRYKQCGNGVSEPVAFWIGSRIERLRVRT